MKLLEYEAKSILKEWGIPTPNSTMLQSSDVLTATFPCVLKSQVPVGGRGKAGGIRIAETKEEALAAISELFSHSVKGYLPRAILA
ncbi:MAG TPA: ATP-grasp domain-containing protein, partial [Candidatus Saccharimonadales bacterium]|nr:ATP-grasp domain-containing protein [Candidatus Saccharimonadales bacterium]